MRLAEYRCKIQVVLVKKVSFLLVVVVASSNVFDDAAATILPPNTIIPNACVYQNTGVYQDGFVMVPVYENTVYKCEPGYWLPKLSETCVMCPENSYCPGGELTYSETNDSGLNPCPDGTVAPTAMWEIAQCGRPLHIGDAVLYLRTVRKTLPSLRLDVNGDGVADFFANTTLQDVVMNKNTQRKFKVKMGESIYSVYDDTVKINNSDESLENIEIEKE